MILPGGGGRGMRKRVVSWEKILHGSDDMRGSFGGSKCISYHILELWKSNFCYLRVTCLRAG